MHHAAVAPPPHRSGGGTCSLRLQRIEPFAQDGIARPTHSIAPSSEKRRSLSDMDFKGVIPTAALLAPPTTNSDSPTLRSPRVANSSSTPTPTPPSALLASLRANTLLDLNYMREFSLAKRKPVSERNLSKMSSDSIYSIRISQMELQDQARRLQRLPVGPSKSDDEVRDASTTNQTSTNAPTSRPTPTIRRFHTNTSHDTAASCFPTLWTAPPTSTNHPEPLTKPILKLTYYRQPQPTSHQPTPPPLDPQSTRKTRHQLPGARTTNTLAPSLLVPDGLSPFDLRKCHATAAVTAQHGFLLDQDLPGLLQSTGYDRAELYALWARFKALCALAKSPRGIDKETFRRGIPQLSVEDEFFIDRVFDLLDADGSGILEWQEFVDALSALEKGDVHKRVAFLFQVYDVGGDGSAIHRDQVMQFLLASLLVARTDELVDVARHFVGKIFDAAGCGDSDTMRVEDALRYMAEHPAADIYALFGRTMVTQRKWGRGAEGTLG